MISGCRICSLFITFPVRGIKPGTALIDLSKYQSGHLLGIYGDMCTRHIHFVW